MKAAKLSKEVYKYRKGACENCGAMTHTRKECTERPRKLGAKFSGQGFSADEDTKPERVGFESKRDRWDNFNPENYMEVIEEYREYEKSLAESTGKSADNIDEGFREKNVNK